MCGRFVSTSTSLSLAKFFDLDAVEEQILESAPRYNVAPTAVIRVVLEREESRLLTTCRWGLVPSWAKDESIGVRMINARSETVATKPSFRSAFAKRRCIIPVDGFYEWVKLADSKTKQPYFIHSPSSEPLAFAGLWEEWRGGKSSDPDSADLQQDTVLRTCTIITTQANKKIAALHDRMPVILQREDWGHWLSPQETQVEALQELLVPARDEDLEFFAVSTEVNSARNQGAQLITPL